MLEDARLHRCATRRPEDARLHGGVIGMLEDAAYMDARAGRWLTTQVQGNQNSSARHQEPTAAEVEM